MKNFGDFIQMIDLFSLSFYNIKKIEEQLFRIKDLNNDDIDEIEQNLEKLNINRYYFFKLGQISFRKVF